MENITQRSLCLLIFFLPLAHKSQGKDFADGGLFFRRSKICFLLTTQEQYFAFLLAKQLPKTDIRREYLGLCFLLLAITLLRVFVLYFFLRFFCEPTIFLTSYRNFSLNLSPKKNAIFSEAEFRDRKSKKKKSI